MQFFLRQDGPSCLDKKFTLDRFDSPEAYQIFVKEGMTEADSLLKPTTGCILGSELFRRKFTKHIQNHREKDISGKKELYCYDDILLGEARFDI